MALLSQYTAAPIRPSGSVKYVPLEEDPVWFVAVSACNTRVRVSDSCQGHGPGGGPGAIFSNRATRIYEHKLKVQINNSEGGALARTRDDPIPSLLVFRLRPALFQRSARLLHRSYERRYICLALQLMRLTFPEWPPPACTH